jgi:hypothetical protein
MRQLLFSFAFLGIVVSSALATDKPALATNSIAVKGQGTLEVVAPADWKFAHTIMQGNLPYFALHSPSNQVAMEVTVYWDGFGKTNSKPTAADFERIVSNACVRSYERSSVEGKTVLEKLEGPAVTGTFARFTDATWVPMAKGDYPNVANGMFRSGNLWGKFNLLTYEKDGPGFKQGLQVLESLRRKP